MLFVCLFILATAFSYNNPVHNFISECILDIKVKNNKVKKM